MCNKKYLTQLEEKEHFGGYCEPLLIKGLKNANWIANLPFIQLFLCLNVRKTLNTGHSKYLVKYRHYCFFCSFEFFAIP